VLLAGSVALIVLEGRVREDLLILGALVLSLAAARRVFTVHASLPVASPPRRAVLFYNPKSGGGKAERFQVAREARARGVEPVELHLGDDLATLVHDAIANGADAVGVAGGDGTQAIVAAIASERGLPYVCVPAGTRNHFALDLGVDRDDVVGALDAFTHGGERVVDLAEVNGRCSSTTSRSGCMPKRCSARGIATRSCEPSLRRCRRSSAPVATRSTCASPALTAMNPRLGRVIGSGTRPRLDGGALGITVLGTGTDRNGEKRVQQWSARSFEVRSDGPVAAGIDGEALKLDPPLRFRSRPHALRVRIAPQHPGASPSATMPESPWDAIRAVTHIATHGSS
jgi:diacylglycerol kinase family enzyme